jgi:hypothetical protein
MSLLGTIGIVLIVAIVVAAQMKKPDVFVTFGGYFDGGQLSLPILALSGIVFLAVRRHGPIHQVITVVLYVFFFGPIIAAALMVGVNPGFKPSALSLTNLTILWWSYFILHVVWLITLLLEPVLPTAEEAARQEDDRVSKIKERAAGRG